MLDELFQEIEEARTQHYASVFKPWPKTVPTAGDLSSCGRETVLGIIHGEARPIPSVELLQRFEAGNQIETRVGIELQRLGFPVIEQQSPFELKDGRGRVILRGKIDGKIRWRGERIPFDTKSMHPNIFTKMHGAEDFLGHGFYSRYIRQLMSYLYLTDSDHGFLLLDDCQNHWKFIPVEMRYEFMEGILQQCERAVDTLERLRQGASEEQALPPYSPNISTCRRCWALHRVCFPPRLPLEGEALTIEDDPEMEQLITWRQELHASHLQFEQADTQLKQLFKNRPATIVGKWLVKGTSGERHYKATEAKTITTWSLSYQPLELEPEPGDEAIEG